MQCSKFFTLAAYYQNLGYRQKSLKYLEKILSISQDRATLAKAHLNIGYIYSIQNLHHQSLTHNYKALSYLENTEEWEGIVSAYHSIGLEYQNLGQFTKSMDAYKNGLQISKLRLGASHKLTKIIRTCYLECSKNFLLANYRFNEKFVANNSTKPLRLSLKEDPQVPKNITPLPKYLCSSKESSPLPKHLHQRKSVQYDLDHQSFNKVAQVLATKLQLETAKPACKTAFNTSKRPSIKTKTGAKTVFRKKIKTPVLTDKNTATENLNYSALVIMKTLKMWVCRKKFKQLQNAARTIQKLWRSYKTQKIL